MGSSGSFLALMLASLAPLIYGQTITKCESDVVFALDQSTSMTDQQFDLMKLFSSLIINGLRNYGQPDGTRAGMIKFSTRSTIEFDLNKFKTAAEAAAAVNAMMFDGGITNTHLALRDMKLMFERTRPGVAKIGILITDGDADQKAATRAAAKEMHDKGYNIAVIAIGSFLDLDELKKLASSPDLFKPIADFSKLQELNATINDLICKDECPKTPIGPQVPSSRPENARANGLVNVGVDLLQAAPFAPLIWSARGLCTSNDTTIVGTTTTFAGEVIKLVEASQTLLGHKKECYRVAFASLLSELRENVVDCTKIAKLMTCAVKILTLIQEPVDAALIQEGTTLRDTWNRYSRTVGTVTTAAEARNIITRQEQLVRDLTAKRDATADAAEKARLQGEIDSIQRVIVANKLKLDYSTMVNDMVTELGKQPRDVTAIGNLQARMLAQLRLMRAASTDTQEQNAMQVAISALENAIRLNDAYTTSIVALKTEENRRPIDAAQLVNAQKNVLTQLTNMKAAAGSAVEGNAIQTVMDALKAAVDFNELVNQHNDIVAQIQTELQNTPPDTAKVIGLKKQQVDLLKRLIATTADVALKQQLQSDVAFIENEVQINEAKLEYNRQVQIHNQEVAKDPIDNAKVRDALQKMVVELKKLLPLTDEAAAKAAIQTLIDDQEKAITCFAG